MIQVLSFIFGAVIGSFLNVCIYRLPLGMSLVKPSSHCPYCKNKIKFYHNIPVLSYVLLQGKCAYCGHKIRSRYFWVELLSGCITLLIYLKYGFTWPALMYLILLYALITVTFIDYVHRIIPNKVLLVVISLGIVLNIFFHSLPWKDALLGAVISGGVLFLLAVVATRIFGQESMGMGDVKLASVLGFFLGWKITLLALYLGFVFALLFYLGLKYFRKQPTDKYIPMAPFFSLGVVILMFWGNVLQQMYWNLIL